MREIKFRAWHKESEVMLYSSPADIFIWQHEKQPVELMQYTGLKDKNGKEIYEGDILHFDAKEWRDKEGKGYNFAIEWSDKGGCWCGAGCVYDWSQWCEIIGNIWKNPELLETQ